MNRSEFAPGQRWISNTEPELGLGVLVELTERQVVIHFPAADTDRTYAVNTAPITRVRYQVGDEIRSTDDDLVITINHVVENRGCLTYQGVDNSGTAHELSELELNPYIQFNRPQDRLFAGQIDNLNQYQLRVETLRQREVQQHNPAAGLLGARVQLLPHQIYIAHEVSHRFAPRVLLADEVGLGKTIEAGLIIHQQLFTGEAERVLIVVPETLVHQWLVEMLRRFNLQFTVLDEARCEALLANDPNPFNTTQLALTSLDFLASAPERQQQCAEAGWDLMVVDEAHHLQHGGDPNYQCIARLAKTSLGLLLLTATPEQLGVESHFARLQLLDPDRYFDFQHYREEEKDYRFASELAQKLLALETALIRNHADTAEIINAFLGDEHTIGWLRNSVDEQNTQRLLEALSAGDKEAATHAIESSLRALLDRHGTGRVLFRNTRAAVAGFPRRKLQRHPLPTPGALIEPAAGANTTALLQPELLLGDDWLHSDPRVLWLLEWLKERRREKVLVICHRKTTALALEEHLHLKHGIRASAFHEDLSLIERDRAAAYFADNLDGAQVLVCSEIGSEGRNFQFAHQLVCFDLPLNPDLLEQRIGRLARIGQHRDVTIHVPYYTGSAQEKLLEWYHKGLDSVENSFAGAQILFDQLKDDLIALLHIADGDESWTTFLNNTRELANDLREKMAQGRDRLLELNSCNHVKAAKIIDYVKHMDRDSALPAFMAAVFEAFGMEEEHHSTDAVVVRPTDHMYHHRFPSVPDMGLMGTYNRTIALGREDMQFITWEHPMVVAAMDMILNTDLGNASLCSIDLPPLKPGTLLLEAVFAIHCPAPKELRLERYFSATMLRLLLDKQKDWSAVLSFEQLNRLQQSVPKKTARQIVKQVQGDIAALVQQSQRRAESRRDQVIAEALKRMEEEQGQEVARLKALADINPNIRPVEIQHAEQRTEILRAHLQHAQIGLSALRVVVCG